MLPADLVTDLDLLALDNRAALDFGGSALADKRRVAVEGWLLPRLEQAGYAVRHHRTRRALTGAWRLRSGVATDVLGDLQSRGGTAWAVSSWLPDPATDSLLLLSDAPFRGLYVGLSEAVNSTAGVASVTYWSGAWSAFSSYVDPTIASSISLAKQGRLTWSLPEDWSEREVVSTWGYAVRVQVSSPCAPAALTHIATLSRSRLTLPAARYALGLLYEEGASAQRGRWDEKAQRMFEAAERDLTMALPLIRDEFDVDGTGAIARAESGSVTAPIGLYTWERG